MFGIQSYKNTNEKENERLWLYLIIAVSINAKIVLKNHLLMAVSILMLITNALIALV
nr:MAG TPA: hypothetical protein [Caudoviricetes sp.]